MNDEILNNINLVYKVIRNLNCQIRDDEDFDTYFITGVIGLIKGIRTYDEKYNKGTFLYLSIKQEILRLFKHNSYKKRTHQRELSLNNTIKDIEYIDIIKSNFDLEKYVLDKVYIDELLNKLKDRSYKKYIKEYYGIHTQPLTMEEIAQKHGVSRQNVHQAIHRGLELLKQIIMEEK